jgi:hypothetical protein
MWEKPSPSAILLRKKKQNNPKPVFSGEAAKSFVAFRFFEDEMPTMAAGLGEPEEIRSATARLRYVVHR